MEASVLTEPQIAINEPFPFVYLVIDPSAGAEDESDTAWVLLTYQGHQAVVSRGLPLPLRPPRARVVDVVPPRPSL
jgi:hypothetical protein